jgi:hypothetical protein
MTASDLYANRGTMRTKNKRVSLTNPQPGDIDLEDVLLATSRTPRFTGHSDITVLNHMIRTYMIAYHVFDIREPKLLKTIFMHDGHEAYVNDVSNPMKVVMRRHTWQPFSAYDVIEERMMIVMAEAFDLFYPHPPEVAECDFYALAAEVELSWNKAEVAQWGLTPVEHLFMLPDSPRSIRAYAIELFVRLTREQEEMYGSA